MSFSNLDPHSLYQAFGFSAEDIRQGEKLFAAFLQQDAKERLQEIVNITSEKRSPDELGYCDPYYLYGKFPDYRKVLIINVASVASEEERERLAWTLYTLGERGKPLEFLTPLLTYWVSEEFNPQVAYWLYLGLLYRSEAGAVREFLDPRFKTESALAKAAITFIKQDRKNFLQHLQNDPRDRQYCEAIWKILQEHWPQLLSLRDRWQIAKALNLSVDESKIWRDEIILSWPLDSKAKNILTPLHRLGKDVRYQNFGEIGRDGPLGGTLTVRGKPYKGSDYYNVGAPLIYDPEGRYLCCTDWLDRHQNELIFIDLNTGESRVLAHKTDFYTPWRFYEGCFWILVGDPSYELPLDLKRDLLCFSVVEVESYFKKPLSKK